MINIKMQICGLIIVTIIAIVYSRHKKIYLNTEKAYTKLIILTAGTLLLDMLSLVALCNIETWPLVVVDLCCKVYLCGLAATALCSLLYVCADVYHYGETIQKMSNIYYILYAIFGVLILFLPIYKSADQFDNSYTYGPSVIVTYVACMTYVIITIITMTTNRSIINPRRVQAVYVWMGLLITSAIIQFFFPSILLIGFSGALGVMVMYIWLENPETNRDRENGLFTESALIQYLRQFYNRNEDYKLLAIVMHVTHTGAITVDLLRRYELSIIDYVSSLPGVYAFQGMQDEIVLVMKQDSDLYTIEAMVRSRFAFGWNNDLEVPITPQYYLIPSGNVVSQAEDVLPFIHYVRNNYFDSTDTDRIILDDALHAKMRDVELMEHLIQDSLKQDRVEVFYQPIYSTEDECFSSAEALCRILDINGKLVPPSKFIEVAENNGMILDLGRRVFEKVCEFIQSGVPKEIGMKYIEVNLSVVQCVHEHMAEEYIAIMNHYDIDPSMINLEITETGSANSRKAMMENISKLIDYGVSFSLDDFGTGHSNLNYIVEMPVNIVKFDRSMILAYFKDQKAKYVMDAAMHMIQGMNLHIVSEGIETEEQLRVMIDLNIQYIQGYYFSKPLPKNSFVEFMRIKNGKQQENQE